ncbi:MAG: hypothetical protein ACPGQL_06270 [Thermoplasmatota archaeon]
MKTIAILSALALAAFAVPAANAETVECSVELGNPAVNINFKALDPSLPSIGGCATQPAAGAGAVPKSTTASSGCAWDDAVRDNGTFWFACPELGGSGYGTATF